MVPTHCYELPRDHHVRIVLPAVGRNRASVRLATTEQSAVRAERCSFVHASGERRTGGPKRERRSGWCERAGSEVAPLPLSEPRARAFHSLGEQVERNGWKLRRKVAGFCAAVVPLERCGFRAFLARFVVAGTSGTFRGTVKQLSTSWRSSPGTAPGTIIFRYLWLWSPRSCRRR